MDELQLIRDRAETVGLASLEDLAPARQKLLAAARAERPSRAKRWFWATGVTVGLAAAATAVISLGPADQVGVGVGVAHADPVRVLSEAASAALKDPTQVPRPDQFLYVKTTVPGHGTREVWYSVDGTRDGLIDSTKISGCFNGHTRYYGANDPKLEGKIEPWPCTPQGAYRTDLPTTADGMLAYLNNQHKKSGRQDVSVYGKDIFGLAAEQYLSPASYAALFQAAAKIPGLQALDHVTDGAGRPGVGITWPNPPDSPKATPIVLVFDATTYAFMGTTDSAVTVKTFVDQVGQRP